MCKKKQNLHSRTQQYGANFVGSFSGNFIGDQGAESLATALPNCSGAKLRLRGDNFGSFALSRFTTGKVHQVCNDSSCAAMRSVIVELENWSIALMIHKRLWVGWLELFLNHSLLEMPRKQVGSL